MKTVNRSFVIAAALVALSGLAFSAESDTSGGAAGSAGSGPVATSGGETSGTGTGGTCTDCFDP